MKLRRFFFSILFIMAWVAMRAGLKDFQLLPSPESQVASLSTIKITFPEAKFLGMYGSQLTGVTLTKVDDPSVVYEPCNISYSTFFSSNSETFSLCRRGESTASVVSEPGEYRLHFPDRCFDLSGDWYSHLGYSEEINVTYTIGDSGGGFEHYFDQDTVFVRPLPGEVMEFKDITVSFPVTNEYPTIDIIDSSLITMTREGDNMPEYVICETSFDGEGTVSFNFRRSDSRYTHPEYIHEPGHYTIMIPEGVFRLTSTDIVNEKMILEYDVTGTNQASEQFRNYKISPQPGTLERIESIILEYPDLHEDLAFPDGVTDITDYIKNRVILKRLNADPDLCSFYEPYSATLLSQNRIKFLLRNRVSPGADNHPETIVRQGDYQFTVLPNTFKLKSNTFAFNARIEAYYRISRSVPSNPMEKYTLSPADGEELGYINTVSVTFPEATEGLVFPIDRTMITLTNTADESDIYEARNVMIQGNTVIWGWNRPKFAYDENITVTKEGIYRLRIQKGAMSEYSKLENKNPEITALYHVSPDNIFNYKLSPEPDHTYSSLPEIKIEASEGAFGLNPTGSTGKPVTFREASGISHSLECTDDCRFVLPAELGEGNYTLTIPEGYFIQTNSRGKEISNGEIVANYRLAQPSQYTASIVPESGSRLTGISAVSITPTGAALRSFGVNENVGSPVFTGEGVSLELKPSLSPYSVSFIFPEDLVLPPGRYTLKIPAGYITVVDGNGLPTSLDDIEATYNIVAGEATEFCNGIFILNEGAFGSEFGSLNYLDEDYKTIHYRVFSEVNAGKTPGVTSQYGVIYGSNLYIVSKQASYDNTQGLLTVADATTMKIKHQTPLGNVSGRAVTPVSDEKAYIGTSDGIYIYDVVEGKLQGAVAGTETSSGKYDDQIGDMIRFGKYLFAAVQGKGIYVVDPDEDSLVATLPLPQISGIFATGGGMLIASADDASGPFVEVDSETLELKPLACEAALVLPQWESWRALPLTSAIRGSKVFYVTEPEADHIASYDFDSGIFTERAIMIPSYEGKKMFTYGTALSTDPETGYIVVTATGGVNNYKSNVIFFADPTDGQIMEPLTFPFERNYWFPAMTFYGIDRGPVLSTEKTISIAAGTDMELNVASMTYLSTGNPYLTVYSATSSDNGVCTVERTGNGIYTLSGVQEGTSIVSVTADYRGVTASSNITVTVTKGSSVEEAFCEEEGVSVADLSGRIILRNASSEKILKLPHGFYIIEGKLKLIN